MGTPEIEISRAQIHEALEAMLASPIFATADRQVRFLRYAVEKTLSGEPLKESLLAVEVYGRGADYDPKTDSIVRVEAGRLRARLKEYYDGPGRYEPLRIELPKGAYVCTFVLQQPSPLPDTAPSPPAPQRRWIAPAAALVLLAAGSYGWVRLRPVADDVATAPEFLEAHRELKIHPVGQTLEQSRTRAARAVRMFEELSKKHPGSAAVQSGLAEAYLGLADLDTARFTELHRLAGATARRGIALNGRLDELHHSLGVSLFLGEWDLQGALESFNRAVEINPRNSHTHRLRADVLCIFGRFEEALQALSEAQGALPVSGELAAAKASVYYRWRRYEQAAQEAEQALAMEPGNTLAGWVLGLARQHQGRAADAEALFRKLPFRPLRNPLALAHLLATTGRAKEALSIAAGAQRAQPTPAVVAIIHAAAGDVPAGLKLLDEAYATRDLNLLYLPSDPRADVFRTQPHFIEICGKLRIPAAP